MPTPAPAWRLQRSRRAKGWYYQLLHPALPGRSAVTLGYLTDDEAALVAERLPEMPPPDHLALTGLADPEAPEDAPPPPMTPQTLAWAAKVYLLDATASVLQAVAAEHARTEAARLEAAGKYGDLRLRDFWERVWWPVRSKEAAPGTVQRERWLWERHILPGLGEIPVRHLDAVRWTRFLASKETWNGRTRAICQTAYRTCMTYAREIGAVEAVHAFRRVVGSTARVRDPVALTLPELTALLEAAPTPMHRALWATAAGQGLRPGEASAVRWEDVDFEARTLRVRGTKTALSTATIPLTPLARREMASWWEAAGKPASGIAFQHRGRQIGDWGKALQRAAQRAGITRRVHPNALRHTFATLCAMSGVPKAATKAMLRHSSKSEMLERVYEHPAPEQIAEALARFPGA